MRAETIFRAQTGVRTHIYSAVHGRREASPRDKAQSVSNWTENQANYWLTRKNVNHVNRLTWATSVSEDPHQCALNGPRKEQKNDPMTLERRSPGNNELS